MAAEVQTGMEKQQMKQLLMKSKKEPVNCAIGMGKDASVGLFLLDRIKAGPAVVKELEKQIPDAKNTRFGTAMVDVDDDPKLVKIRLNKPVSSMARKLVKTLKGTGITKVEILLEDGTPVESYTEEEEQPAAGAAATAGAAQPASTAAPPPPPPPPPQAEAKPDATALTQRLAELLKRMPVVVAAVPAQKDALTKLATDANVQLKTNNLVYAGVAIEQLSRALDAAAATAATATATGAAQKAPPPPPPPPQAAARPDATALTQRLAELLKRMPAVIAAVPAQKDALTKLATDANVQLKTNNLVYAATTIEQLSRALDAAAAATATTPATTGATQPPAATGAVAYAKSRLAWLAARKKVESEIEKLRGAIVAAYSEDGIAADLEKRYVARVAPVLEALDESLADKLDEATNATDTAKRAALVAEAKEIMGDYTTFLNSDKTIAELDANPFVPLAIQQTISGTLSTLQKTIR